MNVSVVVTQDATRSWVGAKDVAASAAIIAQQCPRAGLRDRIHLDLVLLLLGSGVRLFANLGSEPIPLETLRVIEAPGVTHLDFRVVKAEPRPRNVLSRSPR